MLYDRRPELEPREKAIIDILYKLKDTVRNGELLLLEIKKELPEELNLSEKTISSILNKLGLITRPGTGCNNHKCLVWDKEKIENLLTKNRNIRNFRNREAEIEPELVEGEI